jgi:hypothetical protein
MREIARDCEISRRFVRNLENAEGGARSEHNIVSGTKVAILPLQPSQKSVRKNE